MDGGGCGNIQTYICQKSCMLQVNYCSRSYNLASSFDYQMLVVHVQICSLYLRRVQATTGHRYHDGRWWWSNRGTHSLLDQLIKIRKSIIGGYFTLIRSNTRCMFFRQRQPPPATVTMVAGGGYLLICPLMSYVDCLNLLSSRLSR